MERAWHIERVNSNPFPRRFNVAPTTAIPLMCQDTEPIFIGGNRLLSDVFGFAWTGSGGEWGIRTPEPLRANGFQDRRIRPLCQLSGGDFTRAGTRASKLGLKILFGARILVPTTMPNA